MDPRWPIDDDEKRLLTHRQPGLQPEEDFKIVQTETNRRREIEEAAAPAPLPVASQPAPDDQFFPPPPPQGPGPDRLHKWAPLYVFVANDHNPGEDPIINPAFRSATAIKSTINDAYNFARNTLAPKAKPGQRIVILVIGGYYEEDIEIVSTGPGAGVEEYDNIIDFVGLGKPITKGEWRVTSLCGTVLIQNFRMLQTVRNDLALRIDPRVDTRSPRLPGVTLRDLHVYGEERAVEIQRQILCEDSIFEQATYAPNGISYTTANINVPFITMRYVGGWRKWAIFRDCQFLGAATSIKTIKGNILKVTSRQLDLSPDVAGSFDRNWELINAGVILQHSRITGWVENECFRLGHQECIIIGGSLYPAAAGGIYLSQASCSDPTMPGFGGGVNSQTFFDGGLINSAFIARCRDLVVHSNGITGVYVRHVPHLAVPPGGSAILDAGLNASEVYVTMSSTGAAAFHAAPIVNLGNTLNVPLAATEDFYFDER